MMFAYQRNGAETLASLYKKEDVYNIAEPLKQLVAFG